MKNGPGLEPETSGTMYHDSSNWAIQPSDGGFHKKNKQKITFNVPNKTKILNHWVGT